MLLNAAIDFSMPLYSPRDSISRTAQNAESMKGELKTLGEIQQFRIRQIAISRTYLSLTFLLSSQASLEALLIDNKKESMLFIDTSSADNVRKFFAEIDALVLRNADPGGHQMLSLHDMPLLATSDSAFSFCSVLMNHASYLTAQDIDSSTGVIIKWNQMIISKPILPVTWRSAVETLRQFGVSNFSLQLTSDPKTNIHIRERSEAHEIEIGNISRLEVITATSYPSSSTATATEGTGTEAYSVEEKILSIKFISKHQRAPEAIDR
jgi:hypothetical protein